MMKPVMPLIFEAMMRRMPAADVQLVDEWRTAR